MPSKLILPLSEISKDDIAACGGKGASLGELVNAGFPVPSGFVVTTEAFRKFRTQEFPKDYKEEVLKAFDQLGSPRVAVRSSAVAEDSPKASWAGQFETFLSVERDELLEKIRECWNSVKSERARAYATQQGLDAEKILVAVVVQKMVDSQTSGVMFTANPVNKNENEVIIEAAPGLGEDVVQGRLTPDNFVVDKQSLTPLRGTKKTLAIKSRDIHADSDLEDSKIRELTRLGVKIESHYDSPQDIEWAQDDSGKIWILQSRPVTTL